MSELPFIFICHYKKNIDRFNYLIKKYNNLNFVNAFDKEEIQDSLSWAIDKQQIAYKKKILQIILPTLQFNLELIYAGKNNKYISPSATYNKISKIAYSQITNLLNE